MARFKFNIVNLGFLGTIKKACIKIFRHDDICYESWAMGKVAGGVLHEKDLSLPEGYRLFTSSDTVFSAEYINAVKECIIKTGADVIYADEDVVYITDDAVNQNDAVIYQKEEQSVRPVFKPDFNIDLLCGYNYIGDTFLVSEEMLDGILYESVHELLLMLAAGKARFAHIPQILYHSKRYAYEADKKAVERYLSLSGDETLSKVISVKDGELKGTVKLSYSFENTTEKPLVSIVIANNNHKKELERCVKSIFEKSDYRSFEIVIVENNSTENDIFEYYEELKSFGNVKVVTWEGEFNYSAVNNFGVRNSSGEYILLLNNDTELISEDGISSMLGVCQRADVGAVGARLYYPDNTIQHAGIIVGLGGIAGHIFVGTDEKNTDFLKMLRICTSSDYSAVTAACLMTKRCLFEELGGLDEGYTIALNDIDYCYAIRAEGRLVVYDASSRWYHYEYSSRGSDDTAAKLNRYVGECKRLRKKWPKMYKEEDPYYNSNLTLYKTDCSLRL